MFAPRLTWLGTRTVRRGVGLVVLGTAALAAGAWVWTRDAPTPHPCEEAAAPIDATWSAGRSALLADLHATAGWSPEAAAAVRMRLDAFSRTWRVARVDACETRDEATAQCLDAARMRVHRFVSVLAEGVGLPEVQVDAAFELVPLSPCSPAASVPSPDASAVLDDAAIRVALGEAKAALDAVDPHLVSEDPRLRIEARRIAAEAWARLDAPDRAVALLEPALFSAMEQRWPRHEHDLALRLAELWVARQQVEEATRWSRHAAAVARRDGLPRDPRRPRILARLARARGDLDEASEHFEAAWTDAVSLEGDASPLLVALAGEAATLEIERGRIDLAGGLHARAVSTAAALYGPRSFRVEALERAYANVLAEAGRHDAAAQVLETLLASTTDGSPPGPDLVPLLVEIGEAELAAEDLASSKVAFERALAIPLSDHDAMRLYHARARLGLSRLEMRVGAAQRALEHLDAALAIHQQMDTDDTEACLPVLYERARVSRDLGRSEQARHDVERGLAVLTETGHARHPQWPELLTLSADLDLEAGETRAVLEAARRGLEIAASIDPDHPAIVVALGQIGAAALALGRPKDAAAAFERAAARLQGAPAELRIHTALGHATALWQLGDRSAALAEVEALRDELHADASASEQARRDVEAWLQRRSGKPRSTG